MRKFYSLLLFVHIILVSVFGQAPQGYYDLAEGKSDAALKTALYETIRNPSVLSYGGLWTAFRTTDNLNGRVWDMYSECDFTFGNDQCGNYSSVCDCYNREHSFPKSWFNDASPMYSDLFHLYPTDGKVNGMRSNYAFGEVGTNYTAWGTAKLGSARSDLGYSGTVFEPADEYKGDFARTYFYMITCYENRVSGWNSPMLSGNGFTTWATAMLLTWHRNDPVSEKETNRNNAVQGFQRNRNPFIDHPELVEYIWGNRRGDVWSEGDIPRITSPANNAIIDLGTVAYLQSASAEVMVRGVNLTGDLTLSITGEDAALYSLSQNVISQADALTGTSVMVYLAAQEVGQLSATLHITGGGASVNTNLTATATDDFLALPATYLSSTGFTANWALSANATGYSLDVYSLRNEGQGRYELYLDEDFDNGLPDSWTKEGYIEAVNSAIRLASGGQRGTVTTPVINFNNQEAVLTVSAQQYRNDDGAELTASLNGSDIAVWQTDNTIKEYVANIAPTASGRITLSAQSGERVYLEAVKIESSASQPVRVSVEGYPLSVGNVLSYAVTGLLSDSTYYYAVTPEGNGVAESNSIRVHTLTGDVSLPESEAALAHWFVSNDIVYVFNLPENCSVRLVDVSGKQVKYASGVSGEVQFGLPQRGVYILQIIENEYPKAYKILY